MANVFNGVFGNDSTDVFNGVFGVDGDGAPGTGQTGAATLIGYGQQAAGIVTYAQQSAGIVGYGQQSVTLESP